MLARMLWILDPRDTSPLHQQVARCVRDGIAAGDLGPGQQLPTSRELARDLGLNMHTVLRAYQRLQEEGVVDLRRGRGATVTAAASAVVAPDRASDVEDLLAEARALGARAGRAELGREALTELMDAVRAAHAVHAAHSDARTPHEGATP